jgi:hypothetical protein
VPEPLEPDPSPDQWPYVLLLVLVAACFFLLGLQVGAG